MHARPITLALALALGASGCAFRSTDQPPFVVTDDVTRFLKGASSGHVGCKPAEVELSEVSFDWAYVDDPGQPEWSHTVMTWTARCGDAVFVCHSSGADRACAPYQGAGAVVAAR